MSPNVFFLTQKTPLTGWLVRDNYLNIAIAPLKVTFCKNFFLGLRMLPNVSIPNTESIHIGASG